MDWTTQLASRAPSIEERFLETLETLPESELDKLAGILHGQLEEVPEKTEYMATKMAEAEEMGRTLARQELEKFALFSPGMASALGGGMLHAPKASTLAAGGALLGGAAGALRDPGQNPDGTAKSRLGGIATGAAVGGAAGYGLGRSGLVGKGVAAINRQAGNQGGESLQTLVRQNHGGAPRGVVGGTAATRMPTQDTVLSAPLAGKPMPATAAPPRPGSNPPPIPADAQSETQRMLSELRGKQKRAFAGVDDLLGGVVGYNYGKAQRQRGEEHSFGVPQVASLLLPGGLGYQVGRGIAHAARDKKPVPVAPAATPEPIKEKIAILGGLKGLAQGAGSWMAKNPKAALTVAGGVGGAIAGGPDHRLSGAAIGAGGMHMLGKVPGMNPTSAIGQKAQGVASKAYGAAEGGMKNLGGKLEAWGAKTRPVTPVQESFKFASADASALARRLLAGV